MAGRAFLYGLGAGGERGVDKVMALLEADLRRTMALTGCRQLSDVGPELIRWRAAGS